MPTKKIPSFCKMNFKWKKTTNIIRAMQKNREKKVKFTFCCTPICHCASIQKQKPIFYRTTFDKYIIIDENLKKKNDKNKNKFTLDIRFNVVQSQFKSKTKKKIQQCTNIGVITHRAQNDCSSTIAAFEWNCIFFF